MGTPEDADLRQFLSFTIAGTAYAVPILGVREIIQCEAITPVPGVPRSIRGVINLRGSVVPVVDLAVRFAHRETELAKRTCVLVLDADLGGDRTVVGVMADAVREVVELAPGDILDPPSFGTQVRVDFLVGMASTAGGFALLLDLDRVLASGEEDLAAARAAATGEAPAA